jgi:hypothetical protein
VDKGHDASASATGYLFQCRYALLLGLKATIDTPNVEISIEKFDDIAFESGGDPSSLLTKLPSTNLARCFEILDGRGRWQSGRRSDGGSDTCSDVCCLKLQAL